MFRSRRKIELLLSKADFERDAKRWPAAAELYKAYLKQRPDAASIWMQLGHSLKESGDLDGAEQAYVQSISLDGDFADSFLQMGHLLKLKNRLPQAIENYRRALELDPELFLAAQELAALGADPSPEIFALESLETLPSKVDALSRRLEMLENAYAPATKQMAVALDRASAIKAIAFELERHRNRIENHDIQLSEVRSFLDSLGADTGGGSRESFRRIEKLEEYLRKVLEHVASSKATALGLSRLEKGVKTLSTDLRSSLVEVTLAGETANSRLDGFYESVEKACAEIRAEAEALHAATKEFVEEKTSWLCSEATKSLLATGDRIATLEASITNMRKEIDTAIAENRVTFSESMNKAMFAWSAANEAISLRLEQRLRDFANVVESTEAKGATRIAEVQAATEQRLTRMESEMSAFHAKFSPDRAGNDIRRRIDELDEQLAQYATVERVERMIQAIASKIPALNTLQGIMSPTLESLTALEQRCQKIESALTERQTASAPLPSAEKRLNALSAQIGELERACANSAETLQVFDERQAHFDADRHTIVSTLDYLLKRVEFVRREVLFEFQHGSAKEKPGAALRAVTHIINVEKVAQQKERLRLNLGCGHLPLGDYLNIDRRELPGVDIVAEADDLPFSAGEVTEIHSAHMLEHFPQEELIRKLLPYWFCLLSPGGRFTAIVPDAGTMIAKAATQDYPFAEFREVFFGAQDYAGDFHYNMFTTASLKQILEQAGFIDVEIKVEGRRNGACYEMELMANKPISRNAKSLARRQPKANLTPHT